MNTVKSTGGSEGGQPAVFFPLRFLTLDGRYSLRQEEFFGDIFVQIYRDEGRFFKYSKNSMDTFFLTLL
jgi:hypothetical protein